MAVSLGDSCGCVCQRGSYCCLLAVLSTWYAREHTFRNQHVCTVLSYLAQNIVPDPWKTAGVLSERDKNEVLHLLKLKCWTRLPYKYLFLRLTVQHDQEEEKYSALKIYTDIWVYVFFKPRKGTKMGRGERTEIEQTWKKLLSLEIKCTEKLVHKRCFYRNSRHNHSLRNWPTLSPLSVQGTWGFKPLHPPFWDHDQGESLSRALLCFLHK